MTSMKLRDLDPVADAPDVVALLREVSPIATITPVSWLHAVRATPARVQARRWVAEVDGHVVGRVEALLNPFTGSNAYVHLAVREAWRRQGIGSALYEQGLAHALSLEAPALLSDFYENDAGRRFAEARGFTPARMEQLAVLDPREVVEMPPPDLDLRSARNIDPHDLHRVDETATRDMPQVERVEAIPYDEWAKHILEHPLFMLDGTFVAYVDGEPAATSMLIADRETGHATNMFTGTLPEYRGRGLALACKVASIRWAAANGITQLATSNDETNAPMLAINRRLGYRPAGRRVEYVKELRL
jgi:GNAT superfamily N-acetyltransferase